MGKMADRAYTGQAIKRHAITNDGREISYIERQDALVNKKMNIVD